MLTVLGVVAVLIGLGIGLALGRLTLALTTLVSIVGPVGFIVWLVNEGDLPAKFSDDWQNLMLAAGGLGLIVGFVAYPFFLMEQAACHMSSSHLHPPPGETK
jgi:hypothetical protein